MGWGRWAPYVPVAKRRAGARKKMDQIRKEGKEIFPVTIEGRKIARTFWGEAWCEHLEKFSDFENRLPRGRTYVRNGSVCHLEIAGGLVTALVSGSELYTVKVTIKKLGETVWASLKRRCAGQIGSLLELLQGRLSKGVMEIVTDRTGGLFPLPGEMGFSCSCPDWAVMCKHVAAVLYGVGARLDERPELLFLLRGVDQEELISTGAGLVGEGAGKGTGRRRIEEGALGEVFGIELSGGKEASGAAGVPERVAKETTPKAPPRAEENPPNKPKVQSAKPAAEKAPARTGPPKTGKAGPQKVSPGAVPKTVDKVRPKTPAATKPGARRAAPPAAPGAGPRKTPEAGPSGPLMGGVTGEDVARLRKTFGMLPREFAELLGVSVQTVANWEAKGASPLTMHSRPRAAWEKASRMSKGAAWKALSRRAP